MHYFLGALRVKLPSCLDPTKGGGVRNEDMQKSISGKGFDLMKNSEQGLYELIDECTVNSEIFARLYYHETLHMRSFVIIKPREIICPLLI